MSAGKAQLLSKIKDLPETAGASPEEEEQERDLARKKVGGCGWVFSYQSI